MDIATKEQLIRATGYKAKSKQIEWLKKQGKAFSINRFGEPIIAEAVLLNLNISPPKPPQKKWQSKIQV